MARKLHIRWMIRRDLTKVLDMETSLGGDWNEDDFLLNLRQRNVIGMIAERGDDLEGFFVYEMHRDRLHVLKIATVTGEAASELFAKLEYKRVSHKRPVVTIGGPGGKPVPLGALPAVDASWLTFDVLAMCAGDEPPYAPILADALQDAGCNDERFLGALRAEGVGASVYAAMAEQFRG